MNGEAFASILRNRVTETSRDQLSTHDGPAVAEFIGDEQITQAMAANTVSQPEGRTIETVLVNPFQPDRRGPGVGLTALERGTESIVDIEVASRKAADSQIAHL